MASHNRLLSRTVLTMSSLPASQTPDLTQLPATLTHFDGSTVETTDENVEVRQRPPAEQGPDELMDRVAAQLVTTSRARRRHRLKWFALALLVALGAIGAVLVLEHRGHLPPTLTDFYQHHQKFGMPGLK